jgi:2-oxo-4-hydroxy-4-carboxy-5-ureidoimidazoline decarboxylase
MRHTVAELNSMSLEEFVRVVGPVFEHSPWISNEAADKRPFRNVDELLAHFQKIIGEAPLEKQLGLLNAHPDLASRGTLTAASAKEQASAGFDKISEEERSATNDQNQVYRNKFGFPFIICVRLNTRESISAALTERLTHSREQEIPVALEEIFKIGELRLRDLCQAD